MNIHHIHCICFNVLYSILTLCCIPYSPFAERSGSVGRALDWGLMGYWFEPSLPGESLYCVLEHNTLSAALYWFIPERPVPI